MWEIRSRVHESAWIRYIRFHKTCNANATFEKIIALAEKRLNEIIYRKLFITGRFERNLEKRNEKGSQIDV